MMPERRRVRSYQLIAAFFLTSMILCSDGLRSQGLRSSLSLEVTAFGIQKGVGASYLTEGGWEYGAFYQSNDHITFEQSARNYPFYGVAIRSSILSYEKLTFIGGVKGGLVNQQFLVVTPELETLISITNWLQWGFSMGYRARYPSIGTRLAIQVF